MRHRQRLAEFSQGRSDSYFICRIGKRKQQSDGDRIGLRRPHSLLQASQFVIRGLLQNLALGVDSLLHTETQFSRDQRLDSVEEKVIQARACLPPDLDDVFEPGGRDQCDAGAFSLQQGIRADRRSKQQRDAGSRPDLPQRLADRARRVGRSREDLQGAQYAAFHPHAVREGASGINCDAQRGMRCLSHEQGRLEQFLGCCKYGVENAARRRSAGIGS